MSETWCADHPLAHRDPAESYDQANLKKNDTANCLTGNPVFIAPGGNLEQCP